jgi:hypothetical protein
LIIRPLAQASRLFITPLCDGVVAKGVADFASVLRLHADLAIAHPGCRVLVSLDQLGQACYTSGHACDHHELDSVEGHDLSALPPECFEDGDHIGSFTTPAEFPLRLRNLWRLAAAVSLDDVRHHLPWETPGDANSLLHINGAPDAALALGRKDELIAQFVPVERAADALAALPNGYFTPDLNPMQNHVLALHLENHFGLALFGVGASLLGFRRDAPLSEDEGAELAAQLSGLYAETPPAAVPALAQLLTGRHWLLLRYTES